MSQVQDTPLDRLRTGEMERDGRRATQTAEASYWQIAWANKLPMAGFLAVGALFGMAYAVLKTPEYKAVTTVELVGLNQSFLGMSQVDPQAGTDTTTASASNVQTQTRILTSASMLNRVIQRMTLEVTPIGSAPRTLFLRVRSHVPYLHNEPLLQTRAAVNLAASSVTARGVGASRLIEIACQSTIPEVSAKFVNTLAEEHISQTMAARSHVTQKTSQWMDSQLENARRRLEDAGEELRAFVQNSGVDFFPEQSTLADSKLRSLQADVAVVEADRIAKQSRWELARKAPADSLPEIISDPGLMALKGRLGDLRREMAQDLVTLTPNNPRVEKIQVQIAEAEKSLESEKQDLLQRMQNDFEEAQRREKLLTGEYSAQTRTVSSQSDKAAQYATLKRTVEMAQQLYSALLQEASQAALVALAPATTIRVLDPAVPAGSPTSPQPAADIPLGAIAGAAIGSGILYLLEARRREKLGLLFASPGYAPAILGIPELGVIPAAAPEGRKWKRERNLADGAASKTVAESWRGQKSSALAESFRHTLVSILRSRPEGQSPLYAIVSAGASEGKTTISTNLSVAMAESGLRVLLVDADLRTPSSQLNLGRQDRKGLSDLLLHPDLISNLYLDDYLQQSEVPNLQVMTRGLAIVETPALLFFSPRVQQLVARLRARFDWILVDTAPALPFPDARQWGRLSDGVVLVVRSAVSTREGAATVCQRFVNDGVPVVGSILNDWRPRHNGAEYRYNYGNVPLIDKWSAGAAGGKA